MDWPIVAIAATVVAIFIPVLIFLVKKAFKSAADDKPAVAPNDQSIVTVCLGRSFKVGMLYDSCKDSVLTKKMLWNDDELKKATTTSQEEEEETADFEVISNDTLATKVGQLGIDNDLSLSVVSDLVKVSKSAEYLHDIKTSSRQARVVLKCQRFTKTDKLMMKKPAKFTDPKLLHDGTATHVVVGVKYGSESFFVFDREVPEDEDYDSVYQKMESLVEKIPSFAKGKGRPSKEENLLAGKLQYQVYSDQLITQTLSSINDVVSLYKRFLSDSRTEVPKIAWLYPLHLLDKEAPTVHSIEHSLTKKTLTVLDSFHTSVMTANTLSQHGVCKCFPGIRQQLEQFKTSLEEQQNTFKRKLASVLSEIRQTHTTEAELKTLTTDSQKKLSPHEEWFEGKKKEMKFLSQSIRKLEDIEIMTSQRQFDNFKKRHGGSNRIISLEFQVSQESKFTLNETAWYDDTHLTSEITDKVKKFTAIVKSSKEVTTKYVVVTVSKSSHSLSEGVIIYVYKQGSHNPEKLDVHALQTSSSNVDDNVEEDTQSNTPELSDDETDDDDTNPPPLQVSFESRIADKVMDDVVLSEKMTTGNSEDSFIMYKLKTRVVLDDTEKKISKCEFGDPNSVKPTKVIMVMGATGAGKSTLINGMVNYILGVKFEDDFRFKLICDETTKSQSHSQTDNITAYTLYWQDGFQVPFNLTIIDTPGFGDTRGLERDSKISKQVKELFTIKGKEGIDQIHAVGFVTQAALARLTPTQRYIFDSILSIFGNDIKENIFVMATFADSAKPAVLDALKAANLPHSNLFSFNNSALFSSPMEGYFSKPFFEMGISSFQTFFSKLNQLTVVSLSLTREVLQEREKLEAILNGVQPKMREGLSKIETLRQEETMLRGRESEIMTNKEFKYEVNVTKQKKMDLPGGTFVTNCLVCNFTCHKPCGIPNDGDKYRCAAMDNRHPNTAKCKVCPQKCGWKSHRNNPYYFEIFVEKETRTSKELKDRYNLAATGKINIEDIIKKLHEELDDLSKNVMTDIREARHCIQRLGEIALKPNPMTEVEYIELLIKSENEECKPGYQERVKSYEKMKTQAQFMTRMTDEQFQQSLKEEKGAEGKRKWWQFWL